MCLHGLSTGLRTTFKSKGCQKYQKDEIDEEIPKFLPLVV